jgi:FkbM family methyltransferase
MRLIDLLWRLPVGRRTALKIARRFSSFDRRIVVHLGGLLLEIDTAQNLDMQYAYGIYDADELNFLEANYKQGEWFIDIGANMGFYSLYLSKKYPGMKALAFEPDPYNIEKLKRNISLNGLDNILVCEYALADEDTHKDLMLNTGSNRGGNSFVIDQTEFCGEKQFISVPCKTLLHSLIEHNVARIGILKIDVEGFEYPILKAFYAIAPRSLFPRAMVVEAFGENIKRVGGSPIELLVKNGYELVAHNQYNYYFMLPDEI